LVAKGRPQSTFDLCNQRSKESRPGAEPLILTKLARRAQEHGGGTFVISQCRTTRQLQTLAYPARIISLSPERKARFAELPRTVMVVHFQTHKPEVIECASQCAGVAELLAEGSRTL
jgi:hypothetical protein